MTTKIAIKITVNDEGYIEKEVEISPSVKATSEQVGNIISALIDAAISSWCRAVGGTLITSTDD